MLKTFLLLITLSFTLLGFDKSLSTGEIMGTKNCPVCNMKIKKYYKTSHAVKHKNGKKEHFCSMSCLKKGKKPGDTVYVANASTGKMIKASSAIYVVGSDVSGTMGAKKSKIAFGSKSAAQKFQKKHGGVITNYATALKQ
jgi:nitrous oxide reductase accessory protein NosL